MFYILHICAVLFFLFFIFYNLLSFAVTSLRSVKHMVIKRICHVMLLCYGDNVDIVIAQKQKRRQK